MTAVSSVKSPKQTGQIVTSHQNDRKTQGKSVHMCHINCALCNAVKMGHLSCLPKYRHRQQRATRPASPSGLWCSEASPTTTGQSIIPRPCSYASYNTCILQVCIYKLGTFINTKNTHIIHPHRKAESCICNALHFHARVTRDTQTYIHSCDEQSMQYRTSRTVNFCRVLVARTLSP